MQPANKNQLFLGLGLVGLVVVGILIGRMMTNQNQDNRGSASVEGGLAQVGITPTNRQLSPGESSNMTVTFNTNGVAISGIAVRLLYNYTGAAPGLDADNIRPSLDQDSGWMCPVKEVSTSGGTVYIDLGCISTNTAGFSTTNMTELFAFTLTAGDNPSSTPFTIMFDPVQTKITKKSDGQDAAATPASKATVSIVDTNPSSTPVPTVSPNPSTTPTPTLTPAPTGSSFSSNDQDGDLECNQSCVANRDCEADLACIGGLCRSPVCSGDTTCLCNEKDVAQQTGDADLPTAGGLDLTMILLSVGTLFMLGGAGLLGHHYLDNRLVTK